MTPQVVTRWGHDDMECTWGVVHSLLQAGANPLADSCFTPEGEQVNLSDLTVPPRKKGKETAKVCHQGRIGT